MEWLLFAVLGIILAAFLVPQRGPNQSVRGFEKDMDILSHLHRGPGRWILMPRRDERFLGQRGRARARARERRRRVFAVLGEAVALTGLIGAFPPLRAMWLATASLLALLGFYVYLVVRVRAGFGIPGAAGALPAGVPAAAASEDGNTQDHVEEPALDEDQLADAGIKVLAR